MKFSKRKPLPLVAPPVKSRKRARKIVTSFHKLAREIDEEEMRISSSSKDVKVGGRNDVSRLARLRLELEANRQEYQSASLLSVGFHNTSKWVTRELTKLGLRPGKGSPPLKVLEVGAINTRLLDVPWLDVRAIDLKSQHARIEERDFFSLRPAAEYDVVASSMVLNCLPTPERRGEMLNAYRAHLRTEGHLFLMMPLLCLTSSRYTTMESFEETLRRAGLRVCRRHQSPKVAFFCAKAIVDFPGSRGIGSRLGGGSSAEPGGGARAGSGTPRTVAQGKGGLREVRRVRGKNEFAVVLP